MVRKQVETQKDIRIYLTIYQKHFGVAGKVSKSIRSYLKWKMEIS